MLKLIKKKIIAYCGKEIKDNDDACRNGRYDEPHYTGEPIWHLECYEKEHEYAKDKGIIVHNSKIELCK